MNYKGSTEREKENMKGENKEISASSSGV